jgi:hypothetical protein
MRLINVDTYKLEAFDPGRIPKYAILSHTWGEDEVLLQDLEKPEARQKSGWKKIQYSCKEAKTRDISYVWVDTCSIDKSSSAELSESINSMYSWYQRAEVCFAYLEDVVAGDANAKYQIRKSRWFTRGWTLQELVGPEIVEFFSESWIPLGTKDNLAEMISEVTQIDKNILQNNTLVPSSSISKRMSWASTRKTSRPEDIAYCLMGLFDVNMPLLYGEGNRAFLRLQEEIIKTSDDQSIFAWKVQGNLLQLEVETTCYSSMLAPTPFFFQGCGKIVPFFRTVHSSAYTMTNQGLETELPLIIRPPNVDNWIEKRIVLHCRYDDYRMEPLTLRVRGQADGQRYFEVQRFDAPQPVPLSEVVTAEKRKMIIVRPTPNRNLSFYHDVSHIFLVKHNLPNTFGPARVKTLMSTCPDNAFIFHSFNQAPCSIALGYRHTSNYLLAVEIRASLYFSTIGQIELYLSELGPYISLSEWLRTPRDPAATTHITLSEHIVSIPSFLANGSEIKVRLSLVDKGSMGIWLVEIGI